MNISIEKRKIKGGKVSLRLVYYHGYTKDDSGKIEHHRKREKLDLFLLIGQLVERFHIETVWARDIFHLTNRFTRKLLSHTMGVFLNMILGRKALQFESLVEI